MTESQESEFDRIVREMEIEFKKYDEYLANQEKMKTAAEVSGRSGICNTIEKKELINVDRNKDGSVQNPTIQREAQELTDKYGKKSIRTVTGTFWCDSEEKRHLEFERVKSVWPTAKYILYGPLELTEENKKPHLHFIIGFASSKMFKTIIKTLKSSEYHIENCRNYHAAVEYCLKSNPNDKLEYGEPLKQGLRTDIIKLTMKNYKNKQCNDNVMN